MKKFAIVIAIFFIPVIVFVAIVEVLTRQVPNSYSIKSAYLEEHVSSVETLILGNSHAYYGLNPEFMGDNVYNAAFVSQTLDIDYEFLKYYDSRLENLKVVVLRLSYFSLFEQLGKTNEDWRIVNYNLYTDVTLNNNIKHHFNTLSIKLDNNFSVIYDYYVNGIDKVDCNSLGHGVFPKLEDHEKALSLEEAGRIAANRHTINDWSLLDENKELLSAILTFCKEKNIQVLLYTPPAYKSYRDCLNQKQLDLTIETGLEMQRTHNNVRYYNYLNNVKFDAADFFDGDHLNDTGAKKFSLMIANEINQNLQFKNE